MNIVYICKELFHKVKRLSVKVKRKKLQMKRIGYMLLTVLMLAGMQSAAAQQNRQTYSISGKVIDAKTGEAVIGAAVNVEDTGIWAISDESGSFSLSDIRPGNYSVQQIEKANKVDC